MRHNINTKLTHQTAACHGAAQCRVLSHAALLVEDFPASSPLARCSRHLFFTYLTFFSFSFDHYHQCNNSCQIWTTSEKKHLCRHLLLAYYRWILLDNRLFQIWHDIQIWHSVKRASILILSILFCIYLTRELSTVYYCNAFVE